MAATRVLVVDDDLNIQRVLVFTLKQEGFEVHVASDGQAGVEMAAAIDPDLILMDVAMPSMDGVTTARRIRSDSEEVAGVPIVFVTALSASDDRANALAAGGNDYLVKPIDERELLRVVRRYAEDAAGARSAKGARGASS